jgi:hypothetical protein
LRGKASELIIDDGFNKGQNDPSYKAYIIGLSALIYAVFRLSDIVNLIPKKERLETTSGTITLAEFYRVGKGNVLTEDPKYPEEVHFVLSDTFHSLYFQAQPNYFAVREAIKKKGTIEITQNRATVDWQTWQIVEGTDTLVTLASSRAFYKKQIRQNGLHTLGLLALGVGAVMYGFFDLRNRRSKFDAQAL